MEENKVYDVIIIGGGASGLFCAANYCEKVNGLILEKTDFVGKKLLMSGAGQCNLTHGGNIKDFINHYGDKGKKIRSALYKFNNKAVIDSFINKGLSIIEREDGKVFPKSLDAKDVLSVLKNSSEKNGFNIKYKQSVCKLKFIDNEYLIVCKNLDKKMEIEYKAKKVIVAAGGCSYPTTGSDGSILQVLEDLGVSIVKPKPSLVPVFVQNYPYSKLSGISFSPAEIKVGNKQNCDDLLFTHTNFSGPAILNISRFIKTGDKITINYFPGKSFEEIFSDIKKKVPGNSKQIVNFLLEYLGTAIPKRFIEVLCERASIECCHKASSLTGKQLKMLAELLTKDTFSVSGTGGFNIAMATNGGIALEEVNFKNMESKKYPGIFFIGEILDVDGDTGGYNLQFAFSSGFLAGNVR